MQMKLSEHQAQVIADNNVLFPDDKQDLWDQFIDSLEVLEDCDWSTEHAVSFLGNLVQAVRDNYGD